MPSDSNLLVIVPAYNEAQNVGRVIHEVHRHLPVARVLVINDGSTDDSSRAARTAGAYVIDLPYNLGIGGAVQTGLRFACSGQYDYVVRLDGDGQHDPKQIALLLKLVTNDEADVVIGSRYINKIGYRASISRFIGIRLFATLVSAVTGRRYTDTTSGFQVANRRAFTFLADNLASDYPEIEALVLLCRAGFRVREVEVVMRARQAGTSSITTWHSLYYVLKVSLAILIGLLQNVPRTPEVSHGPR